MFIPSFQKVRAIDLEKLNGMPLGDNIVFSLIKKRYGAKTVFLKLIISLKNLCGNGEIENENNKGSTGRYRDR